MIATSPLPLSASCAIPSLLAGQVACQTDREGRKSNGNDKPHAKETCCLPPVLFCAGTTWKRDLSPQEAWKLCVSRAAHPCAGAGFFCFSPISLTELERTAEKHEGEMEGGFSCSLCNFKSYCLLQEHSGQSGNYMRAAHVPLRAHLHGLLLGAVLSEATKLAAWSELVSAWLRARSQRPYRIYAATEKEGKTLQRKLLPGTAV